ncbi:peptidase inhibitor family I36 protein [Sorangium sp. So ce131]|uniref:peptidase inhibitor family I36 protein n=1 Tax=Sorangium sp. So ce131 TaxID=3133282 RepID=UPI003F5E2AA5
MAYSQYAQPDLHEMNNRASSLVNRVPAEICVYARTNYGGSRAIIVAREAVIPKLSAVLNDEIESFKSCR